MIGREDYPILEERTRCAICGSRYRIREEDGTPQLHCEGCDAPAIWERLFRYLPNYNGRYRMWSWMKMLIRTENYRMYLRRNKDMISEDAVRVQSEVRAGEKPSNIDRWMGNEHVAQLLSILTERERYVVIQYFFNHKSQKDLAVELNKCHQMVNQIYYKALKKMREYEYELMDRAFVGN